MAKRPMPLWIWLFTHERPFWHVHRRGVWVKLRFENHLVGAVLDRLGQDVFLTPDGPEHFSIRTDVVVSPQFFAWISSEPAHDYSPLPV